MAQLVAAFVTTRLDYCNGVLPGLPQSTLAPLQRVQSASARLVLSLRSSVSSRHLLGGIPPEMTIPPPEMPGNIFQL